MQDTLYLKNLIVKCTTQSIRKTPEKKSYCKHTKRIEITTGFLLETWLKFLKERNFQLKVKCQTNYQPSV